MTGQRLVGVSVCWLVYMYAGTRMRSHLMKMDNNMAMKQVNRTNKMQNANFEE